MTASEFFKTPLFCLALLAILVRSFIPVGFMPGQNVSMVICTAAGPATVYVAPEKDAGQHQPHASVDTHAPCAFAGGFTTGILPALIVQAVAVFDTAAVLPLPAAFMPAGAVFKPYSSQAPPVLPAQN